jgi:NADH-quinone oxidoreductase subunit J
MILTQVAFYAFSAMAIFAALMMVVSRNPVHAVLFLVLTFVASSGLWILLNAEFLALILVLVYVGAVMTLFLFVVMMLNVDRVTQRKSFVRYLALNALVVLLAVGMIVVIIGPDRLGLAAFPAPVAESADFSNTQTLGRVLYTDYAYSFEIAAMLLLTAIIAAIILTHRPPNNRKTQSVSAQIATSRDDCVRLINMPSEKKISPVKKSQKEDNS